MAFKHSAVTLLMLICMSCVGCSSGTTKDGDALCVQLDLESLVAEALSEFTPDDHGGGETGGTSVRTAKSGRIWSISSDKVIDSSMLAKVVESVVARLEEFHADVESFPVEAGMGDGSARAGEWPSISGEQIVYRSRGFAGHITVQLLSTDPKGLKGYVLLNHVQIR